MTQKPYKCRVEYLESTGTQYIDTGIKGKNNIDFDYKCIFTNLDGTAQCVGGNWSGAGTSTVSLYLGLIRTNGNFAYHYDGTSSPVIVMNTTVQGTPYSIQGHMWVGEQYMVINGTKSSVGTISSTFTSSLNMYLFGINNNGLSNPAYMKLYYCKIYDNGTLARDYIPVLDNSGRPALYDQVSGQLFYNQGSGEFTYGRQIIPVEYLESTGTQYIDTEYAFTDNFTWEIDFNGISDGCTLFGGRTSSTRTALLYQRNYGGIDKTTCPIAGYNGQETPFQLEDLRVGRHKIKMAVASNKGSVWVDGTQFYNEQTFTGSYISGTTQALFADKFGTNDYREQTSSKVYGLKMWQGSTLVRDFIPCKDENNVGFMFDKVSGTVYLNAGTGQFKVGPYKSDSLNKKLLRKKLALMLANLKKKRRYYCEVEYLESTGTQYINTGLLSTANSKVDCVFGFSSMESGAANNVGIFGGRNATTSNTFTFFKIASGNPQYFRFDYNGQVTVGTANQMTWNTSSKYRLQYNGTNYITTNTTTGQSVTGVISPATTFTQYPIHLFAVNTAGAVGINLKGRIYHYWYTDGTNTIDLIPVLDWDMVPCMYDRVTEQLFYNAGSGNFTAGREIHYVEYLESTGTQYIDTGVKLTNNHSVELDYQLTNASQSRAGLFGALNMTGSNQGRLGSILSPSNKYLEHGYGSGNDYWQQGLPDTNRHILYQKKNETYFDGTLIHTFNTATFSLAMNAYLGNFVYTNYTPALAKYYGSKWWDGDTLIREYSPAIDENGVCFWFDKVSHTIYDNAGTGAFKYPAREVEYLEGTGTQYIDTGIIINTSTDEVVSDFQLISTTLYQWIMGEHDNGARFGIGVGDGTNKRNIAYGATTYKVQDAQVYNEKHNFKANSNGVFLDDVQIHGYENFASTSTVYLFKLNLSGSNGAAGKMWLYKHKRNGTLVRDYVPAYKDGSAGMWDKANEVFYPNAGTGSFTTGKIVEPDYE